MNTNTIKNSDFFSPTVIFLATIVFTGMLGVVDWSSGYELQFFVFYFIPIAFAGWNCSLRQTAIVCIICSIVWFVSDYFAGHPYSNISYAIWNSVIRLVSFVAIGTSVVRIKMLLIQERNLSHELQNTLDDVKTLRGMLPICAGCKKIRNDKGYWQKIEDYIEKHSDAQFTHGYCDECAAELLKDTGVDLSGIDFKKNAGDTR